MARPRRISDEELLAVARDVFVEKGFAGSTREIARRAGISEAVIYQRYGNKAEFFASALVPPAIDLQHLLRDGETGGTPLARLEGIALRMLVYFRELVPILEPLSGHLDFEALAQRQPDAPLHRLRTGLVETLAEMQARGDLRSEVEPGPLALGLFASLYGLAVFERLGAHGGSFEDSVVREIVRGLWNGLAP